MSKVNASLIQAAVMIAAASSSKALKDALIASGLQNVKESPTTAGIFSFDVVRPSLYDEIAGKVAAELKGTLKLSGQLNHSAEITAGRDRYGIDFSAGSAWTS